MVDKLKYYLADWRDKIIYGKIIELHNVAIYMTTLPINTIAFASCQLKFTIIELEIEFIQVLFSLIGIK